MEYLKRLQSGIIRTVQQNTLTLLGVFFAITITLGTIALHDARPPELRVSFLDIGQGDAILIEAPNGREIMIDSGRDQSVIEQLGAVKNFFDHTIDFALMTHSDADHIGGFPYVFDRYHISTVIKSEISSPTLIDRTVASDISAEHSDRILARSGERIILDPKHGVVLDILFPDQNTTGWETNDASIVAKLSYGDTAFILTGDSPVNVEQFLVKTYGDQLHADVLKLGHHGSKTSSSQEFLDAVHPSVAIVSAGLGNKYGHPNPEVVDRVEASGIQILETSRSGRITCDSDGVKVSCIGEK